MPAPKHPDSYEPTLRLLYETLGSAGMIQKSLEIKRIDESSAMAFRARFYGLVKAHETRIGIARKLAKTDEEKSAVEKAEAELSRVRRYKATIKENIVIYTDRSSEDEELFAQLFALREEVAKNEQAKASSIKSIEETLTKQVENNFEHLLFGEAGLPAIRTQPPTPPAESMYNPADPIGQTRDPKPGISIETIAKNTADRIKHGSIPKISLPLSEADQELFLQHFNAIEGMPLYELTQSPAGITITRLSQGN